MSPAAVVSSACQMPSASTPMSAAPRLASALATTPWNIAIMPTTVPSSPSSGETVAIEQNERLHGEALSFPKLANQRRCVHRRERLPIDGVVARGQSSVDQSTITGESVPVDVAPGSQVFEGTLNQAGVLDIEVTRLPSESTLARIIQLVENAQEQKAPTQRFLDEFEQKYALGVIAATALAIVIPVVVFSQPFESAFYRAMTLLVVASPCALIISVPAAILSAIANAANYSCASASKPFSTRRCG